MVSFVRGFTILLRRWGRRRRRPRRRPRRWSRHRRRRGPLEVVEDALDRAARVGLDGDEAEDVLGAERGEGLAGVQSRVEPQARRRERFAEPVVSEPPCAALSHCTRFSSEYEASWPVWMAIEPSTEPVVEKDQQLPHWPWFLIGVTAPLATQSSESGGASP